MRVGDYYLLPDPVMVALRRAGEGTATPAGLLRLARLNLTPSPPLEKLNWPAMIAGARGVR